MRQPAPPLRRYSRKAIFKGRLRRSLLVLLFSALFIIFLQHYVVNSTTIPFKPSVIPSNDMQDVFVRSTGPRVVIFAMSDKITYELCYSVGSAYLNGLPVVVAGYKMPYRGFLSKFDFLEKAIKNAGLQPEDVVIVLDSDTFFTGVDINPLLDRFIAQSAATPEELDALAVRQGRAMAPFLAGAERVCWVPRLFKSMDECEKDFRSVYKKVRQYVIAHPEHNLTFPFDLAPQRHLNSGGVIARAWAYKEFLQKLRNLTNTIVPPFNTKRGWNCDQSAYAALYRDLLTWEVEQDVFSMPMAERQAARSPYGMRMGFIGLDHANTFLVVGALSTIHLSELHDEHWVKFLPPDGPERPHSYGITDFMSMGRFAVGLYKKAYAAYGRRIYTKLAVPRWIGGKRASGEANITLTPPLLAVKARPIDTVNNETRHTFPVVVHASDLESGYTKVSKMEVISMSSRWLMPMVHDIGVKRQAMEYLETVPLFLSTNSSIIRDSYHAKCGFPFEKAIRRARRL